LYLIYIFLLSFALKFFKSINIIDKKKVIFDNHPLTIIGGISVVKIRLQRGGAKKRPCYRVVAVDERMKRDGAVIENLGVYHPIAATSQFEVDEEKVLSWLNKGAQPSDTILALLKKKGIWNKHIAAK
jgi:small subunit ribosomal protein S16